MLALQRVVSNLYAVASVLSSCYQKMPQRLYSVASVAANRYRLSYFTKGQGPDFSFFEMAKMCSRENPVLESGLFSLSLENYREEGPQADELIQQYLSSIDNSICKMVNGK
jgi:hypothetical protein